jgi:endonuclease/exonuclease/phosphatase family metal-dependent hydrolase
MRRIFNISLYCTGGLVVLILLLPSCATTELHSTPTVHTYDHSSTPSGGDRHSDENGLKVMTLNVAHGRGTSFHQLLQHSDETVKNLDSIDMLLNQVAPDIVALQEIDGPSFWSGNFNHLQYLASHSLFTRSIQASHVDAIGLSYGTALMSRQEMWNPRAVTFDPSLTLVPTGFVVSTISWPGRGGIDIDVVSVHLDFMSGSARKKQADELIAVLRARNNRLIIMGDLNSGWLQQDSAAQYLVEKLGLKAYQPENSKLVTFPVLGKRLDWVLISPGFEFSSYDVIGTDISDHRGVLAELTLSDTEKMVVKSPVYADISP